MSASVFFAPSAEGGGSMSTLVSSVSILFVSNCTLQTVLAIV